MSAFAYLQMRKAVRGSSTAIRGEIRSLCEHSPKRTKRDKPPSRSSIKLSVFGRSAVASRFFCLLIVSVFLLGVSLPSPFTAPFSNDTDSRAINPPSLATRPRLAWLMSFPGSGTTSTMHLIQRLGHERVATNYGDDPRQFSPTTGTPDPVQTDDNFRFGPFWCRLEGGTDAREELAIPAKWIVTKTHCGGYCNGCSINEYIQSPQAFLTSCATAQWYDFNTTAAAGASIRPTSLRKESYPPSRVGKAIHLIRNPFANVVSRFHSQQRQKQQRTTHQRSDNITKAFSTDRDGFRSFCTSADEVALDEERTSHNVNQDILSLVRDVPCHVDLFRWIEWHNQAFFVSNFLLQVRAHVVHYETLMEERTQQNLMAFLELSKGRITVSINDLKLSDSKQEFQDYYSPEEKDAMKKAAKELSSDTTWENIQHYF